MNPYLIELMNAFQARILESACLSVTTLNTRVMLGSVGGLECLDGISTISQTVGCMLEMYIDQTQPSQRWILRYGTDAELPGAIVRPVDFNVSTNPKVWVRVL